MKEKYSLVGKLCMDCKELFFPPREVCTKCGCLNLVDYKFEGKGEIITYSIIRTGTTNPLSVDIPKRLVPYNIAIIKLDEGPMLTAEIVEGIPEIGQKVEMVFRKIVEHGEAGVIEYGYKFRTIE